MRLLRLHLENFRGVERHSVELDPTGVTVLVGDNEVGKTSLVDSLDMLFDQKDDSRSRPVRESRPVGQDVATVVEADVQAGPYRFTYRKQFHRQPSTRLVVHEPAPEQLAGREAHGRVLSILAEQVDLPLWRALRLQQGVRLDQADLAEQTSLAHALDAGVAESVGGAREETLVARAREEHDRYFTPTGVVRTEGRRLESDLVEACAEVDRLGAAVEEVQRTVDRLDRVRADVAAERAAGAQDSARLEEALGRVAEGQDLVRAEATLRQGVGAAATALALARHRGVQREELRCRAAAAGRERAGAQEEVAAAGQAVAGQERVVAEDDALIAVATQRVEDARAVRSGATSRRDGVRAASERRRVRLALGRHDEALAGLRAAEAAVAANGVDDAVLARVEEAHRLWRSATELAGSSAPVLLLSGAGMSVETDAGVLVLGSEPAEVRLGAGSWLQVGGVRVQGRASGAQRQAEQEVQRASAELADACAAAGVADLQQALTRAHARRAAVAERDRARAGLAAAAGGVDVEEARRLPATAERAGEVGEGDVEAGDVEGGDVEGGDAESGDVEAEVALAEAAWGQAVEEHAAVSLRLGTQRAAGEAAVAAVGRAAAAAEAADTRAALAAADLDRAREEVDDTDVETAVAQAEADAVAAAELAADAAERLERSGHAAAQDDVELGRGLVQDGRTRLRALEDEAGALAAVLEERGAAGLVEQLDGALTRREHAQRERSAWFRRAAAAKALRDALVAAQSSAHQAYVEPLRRQVQTLAEGVFGPGVLISLGADLRITSRTLDGVTVPFDQLSSGAREQLAVLGRLACAILVSRGQGVPVLLDDALGYSDPERLAGMGRALRAAGETCQVVVLTCVPERYRGAVGATTVRLRS